MKRSRRDFLTTGAVGGAVVWTGLRLAHGAEPAKEVHDHNSVTIGYRVWPAVWRDPQVFARLVRTLQKHPAAVDEIALFDEFKHWAPSRPLQEVAAEVKVLRIRLNAAREAGIGGAGINVISTVGHGIHRAEDVMIHPPIINHRGEASAACACPNADTLREYLAEYFQLMAQAGPDVVWVDDDFRTVTGGVRYPCFCSICLSKFGHSGDREQLVAALNAPENQELRGRWSCFYADSLLEVLKLIQQAVAEVDPQIELGLMTVGYSLSTYAGYPFGDWMEAVNVRRGRPGHGYYNDHQPRKLLDKAFEVARQVRDYPSGVKAQYELENWPYITLDKAVATVVNEATAAMAVGCDGLLLNALYEHAVSFEEVEPLLQAIAEQRSVWTEYRRATADLPLVGLWPVDSASLMLEASDHGATYFEINPARDIALPNALAELGLPLTVEQAAACGTLLAGRVAEGLRDEEIREILSDGVLLDSQALNILWSRGFGHLCGVRSEATVRQCYERFTDHRLNDSYAGDGRRAFPGADANPLKPMSEGVEVLSEALSQHDDHSVGACLTIYRNELGGRVAVCSYAPWEQLGREGKRRQLLNLSDWIAGGRLPLQIDQTVRVVPLVRISSDGRRAAVVLLNTAFDKTGPLTLRLKAQPAQVWQAGSGDNAELPVQRRGDEIIVQAPSIPAWATLVLLAGNRMPLND